MLSTRWLPLIGELSRRSQAERDLEVARRLGHWYTEEDQQLLRDHQAQVALARRSEAMTRAVRAGTVGMMVAAWVIPPLWPVAVVASFRVFPRTSRQVLAGVLGVSGAAIVGAGVVVHQALQSPASPPAAQPAALPAAGSAAP